MPSTIQLHRVFAAPPERVFRAFTDADAIAKWYAPHGFTCKVHQLDVREGGSYRMSFTNFSTKHAQSFGGKFLEIKPQQLLRYVDKFEDPNLPGEMQVTVNFREVSCGTEVKISQSGVPDMIPAEGCYLGWQQTLNQLAQVVEPNIPDGP